MEESCNNNATRPDRQPVGTSIPLETAMSGKELGQGHTTGNEPGESVMATAQQQQTSQDPEEKKFMEPCL